jgi:hypothetical protein
MRGLPALALVASACALAIGNKHRYDDVFAELPYASSRKVLIATRDERPYVQGGDKQPNFVGLSRGGYNNPFDVVTSSGKPLADDMSQAIERSLDAKGFDASVLRLG